MEHKENNSSKPKPKVEEKKQEKKQEFPSPAHDDLKTPETNQESSGSEEDSYKAATRGTEIEFNQPHPTKIPHPRDEISR